jgi:hypothetical protein
MDMRVGSGKVVNAIAWLWVDFVVDDDGNPEGFHQMVKADDGELYEVELTNEICKALPQLEDIKLPLN